MKLIVNRLQKSFENKPVLSGATHTFEKGKIYGLLGRNGAGKTTMFNCFVNNLAPDSGEVLIHLDGEQTRNATYDDMGFVFAQPHLPEFMTGQEFLKFFIEINKSKITTPINMDESFALIDFSDDDRHKLIREYSYGMKNKLQILAFLILRTPVILLDEPLTSFDVVVAVQIPKLIESLKKDHIIIFSTHILPLAQDLCDEIVVLHNGKLTELDPDRMKDKDFENQIMAMMTEGEPTHD